MVQELVQKARVSSARPTLNQSLRTSGRVYTLKPRRCRRQDGQEGGRVEHRQRSTGLAQAAPGQAA